MAAASRLVVLDSATLYYRAFHALPVTMTDPQGRPNNVLRGFLDGLVTLSRALRPTHLVCAWDEDWRPAFRVELWPGYKAHRVTVDGDEEAPDDLTPQVDMLAQLLDACGVVRLGVPGYEADDVIASVCAAAAMPVDVVTSDRDLIQCVDDSRDVRLVSIAKGLRALEIFDEAAVFARYGVRPQQYIDYAVMRGDPSDGLPGVAGIGEKTAAALLEQHGDLDGIITAAADPSSPMRPGVRARLCEAAEVVHRLRDVTTAVAGLQLPTNWLSASVLPAGGNDAGHSAGHDAGHSAGHSEVQSQSPSGVRSDVDGDSLAAVSSAFAAAGVTRQYSALVAAGVLTAGD